jgi:biotin carboxylase
MSQQKKLMILGASPGQLPLIHKAVALGHYVITVDYLPDNIGHQFSHQYVNCSTVDQAGVLSAAQELQIDGIATFASDVATASVAFVAEQLALPGCPSWVARTMSNKAHFRRFQRIAGLNSPGFTSGLSMEEITDELLQLRPPLMFKPVDTSGSRGVSRVDQHDLDGCRTAFDYAQRFARSKIVCVEEFVDGIDVSGDGFLVNGQLRAVITQKYKRGYIPIGHSLPTHLSAGDQERVCAEVVKTCHALGYTDGPIDFDVKISPESAVVIEMSPRLGGNGIPKLIMRATGVDLIEATVLQALGQPAILPARLQVLNRCGSRIFGSEYAGRLEHVAATDEVKAQFPEIFDFLFSYQIGEDVPGFEHSGNSLGYALFDCPPGVEYCDMVERIESAMQLRIAHLAGVHEMSVQA